MRKLVALLLALMLALPVVYSFSIASASEGPVMAQDAGEGEDAEEGAEGQDDPATQTGADEEGEAAVEEGPVWTLQMAWITLAMLALMLGAIAAAYHRFVAQRRKQGV